MSNETRTQLERVKELIKLKQYEKARILLKAIDHPIATEWLAKLENV